MKAAILAGGRGTRLRPITFRVPKALLPVARVPILRHQIERIRGAGVRQIASCLRPTTGFDWDAFVRDSGEGVELHAAWEEVPLGTGGAFRALLDWLGEDALFGINGDDLTDSDPRRLFEDHASSGAAVTIGLRRVDAARGELSRDDADPSVYGNVVLEEDGTITAFLEKPAPAASTGLVNAGQYVLEASALARLPAGRPLSIEREGFPLLLEEGLTVRGVVLEGYHRPVNTAAQYLQVHRDLYEGHWRPAWMPEAEGHNQIGGNCRIFEDARLGANVTLGDGCQVGREAVLQDVVAFPGCRIGPGAELERVVLGPGVRVGARATVHASVLGPGTLVPPWASLGRLEPGRRGEKAT